MDYLEHGSKDWKQHKYISKEKRNGKTYYRYGNNRTGRAAGQANFYRRAREDADKRHERASNQFVDYVNQSSQVMNNIDVHDWDGFDSGFKKVKELDAKADRAFNEAMTASSESRDYFKKEQEAIKRVWKDSIKSLISHPSYKRGVTILKNLINTF